MAVDDVLLNKAAIIKRCVKRIKEEYRNGEDDFIKDYTRQDSVILNIQRCCEAAIDMGNRCIKIKRLGIPQSSREVFDILEQADIIEQYLCKKMKAMIGLRNIAVHDYQVLNMDIVISVIESHLVDFDDFIAVMLAEQV